MKPASVAHAPSADLIDLRERAQERLREQRQDRSDGGGGQRQGHGDGQADGQRSAHGSGHAHLKGKDAAASTAAASAAGDGTRLADPRRLLHELEVYQVELELQNEQLEAARAWIEAALASYTELYDYAPVPYLSLNRMGVIVETNLAGARLLGIERARMLDKRLERYIVDGDRHRLAACLKTVFLTGSEGLCELALVTSDGRRRTVEMRAALANSGDSCRAVLIDVSERSAHARHMARLGDVFSLAREAMCISDDDGIIVDVNHAFTVLTGYARTQVVGKHGRMLRSESEAPALEASVARALATVGNWRGPALHRHREGATYMVMEDISTLRDSWGAQHHVARYARQDDTAAGAASELPLV